MCLCRNSCLPKGLTNWTLIYNLPLETNLEGDSSCLQLPVVQEAKSLLRWSCPKWRSQAQGIPALEDCLFWHMLPLNIATWTLHGKGDGHVPLSVLMDCFYVTGCQRTPCSEVATMALHLNQVLWALWYRAAIDAGRNCVCGALCLCCGYERD